MPDIVSTTSGGTQDVHLVNSVDPEDKVRVALDEAAEILERADRILLHLASLSGETIEPGEASE